MPSFANAIYTKASEISRRNDTQRVEQKEEEEKKTTAATERHQNR